MAIEGDDGRQRTEFGGTLADVFDDRTVADDGRRRTPRW